MRHRIGEQLFDEQREAQAGIPGEARSEAGARGEGSDRRHLAHFGGKDLDVSGTRFHGLDRACPEGIAGRDWLL
jgi:hypothetical protein